MGQMLEGRHEMRGVQRVNHWAGLQVEHSVRTSVLEEKATACTMLCCYADELKEGFYPYVEQARPMLILTHN